MTNTIKKTISEIKNDIGVYYHIPDFNYVNDPHCESNDNFMVVWHRMTSGFANFDEKVSFFHSLITGDYVHNQYMFTIKEKFNAQYAKWFGDDEGRAVFKDFDDAKAAMLAELSNGFSSFMKNIQGTLIYKTLQTEGLAKKVLLKTLVGKKLNFLIANNDAFDNQDLTTFIQVVNDREYETDYDEVIVPVNWDVISKSSWIDFTYIKDYKVKDIRGYLLKASYDKESKSMDMHLELEDKDIYNFPHYFFDKEKEQFVFSSKDLFFTNEEAAHKLEEMIVEHEILTEQMKRELETLQSA